MLSRSWTQSAGAAAMAATLATGGPVIASDPDDPSETVPAAAIQPPPQTEPDFLFGRPRGFYGISGGWIQASQGGSIFDYVREQFTVNEGAFDSAMIRFAFGLALAPRTDLLFEMGVNQATVPSEDRHFLNDNYTDDPSDDYPITQKTRLKQVPLGVSLRYWLRPRGREIGRYAWVPNRVAPYVGIGGGTQRYRFTQEGDFVDSLGMIYSDVLHSKGWAASGHVFGGTSIKLTRRVFAGAEARYVWADTPLSHNYLSFCRYASSTCSDSIDLSGLRITGGIEFVF